VPLQGTLDIVGFADIATLIARRHLTGRLEARSGEVLAKLYFDDGRVVGVSTGRRVAEGDERDILADLCARLLPVERGSFELQAGIRYTGPQRVCVEVAVMLRDGRRRLAEWRKVVAVVPSLDARPRPAAELTGREVTMSAHQWRVLRALDGRRTVRAVAQLLDLRELEVSRILKELLDAGLVELERPAPVAARRVPAPVTDGIVRLPAADAPIDGGGDADVDARRGWRRLARSGARSEPVAAPELPHAG
jgi:DNA-binding transcriptional ArsR family regulator